MSAQRFHGPEMALSLNVAMTQDEARAYQRDLSKVARAFGRTQVKVRRLRAALRAAEKELKDQRREMNMLVKVRVQPLVQS